MNCEDKLPIRYVCHELAINKLISMGYIIIFQLILNASKSRPNFIKFCFNFTKLSDILITGIHSTYCINSWYSSTVHFTWVRVIPDFKNELVAAAVGERELNSSEVRGAAPSIKKKPFKRDWMSQHLGGLCNRHTVWQ